MAQSKKTLIALAAVVAVATVAVLIVGVGGASADEVRFQNASDPGPKPFTPPTDVPQASSRAASADTAGAGGSSSPQSAAPSPPGGSEDQGEPTAGAQSTVCDREKLAAELSADPAKLSAFAEAVGIDADTQAVADYIRKLRPVTLTRDTQVTNHFYDDGSAEPYQAILTKGTAALVDDDAKPIVRCRSGSPLAEPAELAKQTRCLNCPANYRPPPPCEGKCYRLDPDPRPVKRIGTTVKPDPIATAKSALEKCRKDKGGLKGCELEYESARKECAANPLNPLCDSSVCFEAAVGVSDGCSSYISDADIKNHCFSEFGDDVQRRVRCQKSIAAEQKVCAADPSKQLCMIDPKQKASFLRLKCTANGARPECKVLQVACAKNAEQGCDQLRGTCLTKPDRPDCKALSDFKQACAKDPTRPECKDLPPPTKAADPTLQKQAEPDAQEGDQSPDADGTGPDPGGGEPGGDPGGGEPGGGEAPGQDGTQQPDNPSPPEGQ